MTQAFQNFSYTSGGATRLQDVEGRLDAIGAALSNSFLVNNTSSTATQLLNLSISSPLPSGVSTGSIALSGSNASLRLYVYTGVGTSGWQSSSLG